MPREHQIVVRISEAEYLPIRLKAATEHVRLSVVVRKLLASWASEGIMEPKEAAAPVLGRPGALPIQVAGPGQVGGGKSVVVVGRKSKHRRRH